MNVLSLSLGLLALGTSHSIAAAATAAPNSGSVTPFQLGTLAIALIGAGLGTLNTWKAYARDRVRLKVAPKRVSASGLVSDQALPNGEDDDFVLVIQVANLGTFAVTVDEVGFLYRGTEKKGIIAYPNLLDEGEWPRRLEPHASMVVRSNFLQTRSREVESVYVKTASGTEVQGRSAALSDMTKRLLALSQEELKEREAATWRRGERLRRSPQ